MTLVAWGWCTGTTQRDDMGRVERGGFGMGNTRIRKLNHTPKGPMTVPKPTIKDQKVVVVIVQS